MYSVSKEYIAALRKPYRIDKVEGTIALVDGTSIAVSDSNIVRNKLSITRKICGSEFKVGTFNAAELMIAIKDEQAYQHVYNNARIRLNYSIRTAVAEDGTETWETVPLGFYRVDGQQTTRLKDTVTLRAFDSASNFDIEFIPVSTTTTLWGLLQQACGRAGGVEIAITQDEFLEFPNASIVPDVTSKQIQSCRDVVMWVAQTTGCYAYIDRHNRLMLKRYYYSGGGMAEANGDRIIQASERTSIQFSDTRTYLSYLNSYCAGEAKLYYKEHNYETADKDYFSAGSVNLPSNPLVQALTADEQDAVNNAYLDSISYPTRYVKMTGWVDPAIDLLDPLGFTGGNIDLAGLISVATEIKWKYRATGTITCNNYEEYAMDASAAVAVDGESSILSSQVKTQTEKRIDGLEAQLGGSGTADTAKRLQTTSDALVVDTANNRVNIRRSDGKCLAEFSNGNETALQIRFDPDGEIFQMPEYNAYLEVRPETTALYSKVDSTKYRNFCEIEAYHHSGASITHYVYNKAKDQIARCSLNIGLPGTVSDPTNGLDIACEGTKDGEVSWSQTLSFRPDGIYINGKKILTEE